MKVKGANPDTPKTPSCHSWGRFLFFSAHIFQIKQKVIKGYQITWQFIFPSDVVWQQPKLKQQYKPWRDKFYRNLSAW